MVAGLWQTTIPGMPLIVYSTTQLLHSMFGYSSFFFLLHFLFFIC